MNESVSWILELEMQPEREQDFKTLMEEMVESTRDEPGTLSYEWSLTADGRICHIFERYIDSAAAITHLGTFGDRFAARFVELLKPVRFIVYGAANDALREIMAAFNPVYMRPVGGFTR